MAKIFRQYDCNQCKKRVEVFKVLKEEDFKLIEECRYEVLYLSGETIFKQGTSFTHTICILKGLVKVYLESGDRRNFIINLTGPGEMVGSPGQYFRKRLKQLRFKFIFIPNKFYFNSFLNNYFSILLFFSYLLSNL
jgi:signal-transduction protein with cAMP-binding, CBS, and nucleotidyltransferase domain